MRAPASMSSVAGLALAGLMLVSACSPFPAAQGNTPVVAHGAAADPASTAEPTTAPAMLGTATSKPAPDAASAAPAPLTASADELAGEAIGRWTDGQLDGPFSVRGLVVVSKAHQVAADYVPPWAAEPNGLHPEVSAAFARLSAAAAADGRTIVLRSGYRSYAEQAASFANALRTYDEATARRYYAEAGKSEHQTGLALDAWDGVRRGSAFAQTPEAGWLAEHAWEYGFVIRYPEGKTDITGYAWESWHLRWVGEEVARAFGPNSTLTLEEYLGLA